MRRCSRCKKIKPLSDYHKDRSRSNSLAWYCKSCRREYGQLYYAANREKIKAQTRHYRTEHATSTYISWQGMLTRCRNPNTKDYKRYGGRGIEVCARWDTWKGGSLTNFLNDLGERPEGSTLDRIDPDGNYEPDNCRWATYSEQTANRRKFRVYSPGSENAPHCPTCVCSTHPSGEDLKEAQKKAFTHSSP